MVKTSISLYKLIKHLAQSEHKLFSTESTVRTGSLRLIEQFSLKNQQQHTSGLAQDDANPPWNRGNKAALRSPGTHQYFKVGLRLAVSSCFAPSPCGTASVLWRSSLKACDGSSGVLSTQPNVPLTGTLTPPPPHPRLQQRLCFSKHLRKQPAAIFLPVPVQVFLSKSAHLYLVFSRFLDKHPFRKLNILY